MRLSHLLADLNSAAPELLVGGPSALQDDPHVSAVVQDHRRVTPGAVFVARRGERFDGHDQARDAVAKGAVAVVGDRAEERLHEIGLSAPYVRVVDAQRALPHLAAAFHAHPSQQLHVFGVTGTDGKTTTSFLLAHLLGAQFHTGLISTAAVRLGDEALQLEGHFTTPEAPEVQAFLARFRDAGATHAVLESSSHGFSQHRLDAVRYAVGVVTNLTPEHLDHHKTLEAYLEAKATLVRRARTAVLNADDEHWPSFESAARAGGADVVAYGTAEGADVRLLDVSRSPGELYIRIDAFGERRTARLPMVGTYNAWNAAGALAAAYVADVSLDQALSALDGFGGVPGRMQVIATEPFTVIVDFAHTPPALAKALEATRRVEARTIVVVGSAGERDPGKRGPLGAAAIAGADIAVFTEEDSRSEPVERILTAIAAGAEANGGLRGTTYHVEPDRTRAIALAYELADPGDVVLLAGKGHEATLERDGETLPWDEAALARSLLPGPGS